MYYSLSPSLPFLSLLRLELDSAGVVVPGGTVGSGCGGGGASARVAAVTAAFRAASVLLLFRLRGGSSDRCREGAGGARHATVSPRCPALAASRPPWPMLPRSRSTKIPCEFVRQRVLASSRGGGRAPPSLPRGRLRTASGGAQRGGGGGGGARARPACQEQIPRGRGGWPSRARSRSERTFPIQEDGRPWARARRHRSWPSWGR
ncbi:unnamed protein product [Urochloa humidicola]